MLTLGTGMIDPSRNRARIIRVNRIFLRRSGVLKALASALSNRMSCWSGPVRDASFDTAGPSYGRATTCSGNGTARAYQLGAKKPQTPQGRTPDGVRPWQAGSQLGDGAAGLLDLRLGAGGELVRGHVHRDADLAGAQHLDQLVGADRAGGDEVLDADGAALGEQQPQPVQVDDLVFGAERVLE